jgi:hypothetical protein
VSAATPLFDRIFDFFELPLDAPNPLQKGRSLSKGKGHQGAPQSISQQSFPSEFERKKTHGTQLPDINPKIET